LVPFDAKPRRKRGLKSRKRIKGLKTRIADYEKSGEGKASKRNWGPEKGEGVNP